MSDVLRFSFYSDVCKLVAVIASAVNIFLLILFLYHLIFGPRDLDAMVMIVILWLLIGFVSKAAWKRGWPKRWAKMMDDHTKAQAALRAS